MNELTMKERYRILDILGKQVVEHVRDNVLGQCIRDTMGKSPNILREEKYKMLRTLTPEQIGKVNELLSETITDTIFEFLNMLGDGVDIIITDIDGKEYNYCDLTEHGGSEIVVAEGINIEERHDWITKFSKLKL